MRVITAKFNSVCAETGRPIKKGDPCVYDPKAKKVYASGSPTQQKFIQEQGHAPNLDEILEQQSEQWHNQTYGY